MRKPFKRTEYKTTILGTIESNEGDQRLRIEYVESTEGERWINFLSKNEFGGQEFEESEYEPEGIDDARCFIRRCYGSAEWKLEETDSWEEVE